MSHALINFRNLPGIPRPPHHPDITRRGALGGAQGDVRDIALTCGYLRLSLAPATLALSAWGRLLVVRLWFGLTGRLPWRLMAFLKDAHARGVLRQTGALYQFRHIRLQERLSGRPEGQD